MSGYVPLNERPQGGHARLLSLTLADGPRDVLDVGCSSGYLAAPLAAAGARVVGIELDPDAAEAARAYCADVLVGDVESMELPLEPASFDAIVCGDLVEHLRDPWTALGRLRPFSGRAGGSSSPRPTSPTGRCGSRLLGGRWRYTDRGILDRTHTHLFTRKTLAETVDAAGYRVVELDHTAPVPLIGTPAVERAAHAIARVRPSLFAYQFVLAATPR